jgi:hypothetical protein
MVFRLALAWGCSPREVLARIDSTELAEWIAFERLQGPIDTSYERAMLNEIQFQLQTLNYLFGAANFTNEEDGIENPIDEPKRLPFPWEWEELTKGMEDAGD